MYIISQIPDWAETVIENIGSMNSVCVAASTIEQQQNTIDKNREETIKKHNNNISITTYSDNSDVVYVLLDLATSGIYF